MKKVFSSNSALSHAWANQLQEEGRGSSMFFYGPVIYSYGYHYEIARIVETGYGETVCFLNSNGYSNTTAKHTKHVRNAIPDGIKLFEVPFKNNHFLVTDLPAIVDVQKGLINGLLMKQKQARSYYGYFSQASELMEQLSDISNLFALGMPKSTDFPYYSEAKERAQHLRETEQERQKQREQKELKKSLELLNKWMNHEYNGTIYNIPVHLRISKDGERIQTTKGASVPKSEGFALLRRLRAGLDVIGDKIAGFTVIENNPEGIKIGCHSIPWGVINNTFPTVN